MTDHARDLVRSVIDKDFNHSDDTVRALGGVQAQVLVAAAFTLAVERSFAPDTKPGQVATFVEELRERYGEKGQELKPFIAESLIRGALGDESILDGLLKDDVVSTEIAIAFALVSDLNLDAAATEAFITEAIEMADEADE
ncbi:MAG: hypothetical protein WCA46_01510 [Actinocatenispora sp.]